MLYTLLVPLCSKEKMEDLVVYSNDSCGNSYLIWHGDDGPAKTGDADFDDEPTDTPSSAVGASR